MPHLLNIWPIVSRQLARTPRVLVIFDYEGTLAPLTASFDIPRLPDNTRRFLGELTKRERFIVGVVSACELGELERLIALPSIVYMGNQGLEMRGLGMDFVHPEASGFIESLAEVAGLLQRELKYVPELRVHDKRLSLCVHFLNTPDAYAEEVNRTVISVLGPFVSAGWMTITRANKVIGIKPNIDWDKGEAIKNIHQGCGDNPSLMFFGDDFDDEDGFAVVQNANGIAVYIGPPRQSTRALHQLESPAEVAQVLELLKNL